jgi:stage V sporulation protein B
LGIGSIPFLTTVWVEKNKTAVKKTMETIIRITAIIAIPAGIGLCAIAPNIMGLLYEGVAPVEIGAPILCMLGVAAVFSGLSVPMTNMLQAIGKPMLPLRNIAIGAVIKVILNFFLVGIPELNIWGAPIGTAACYVFIFVSNLWCLIKYSGVRLNFLSTLIKPCISGIGCGVAAFGISTYLTDAGKGNMICCVVGVAVAVIVYFALIFALRTLTVEDIEGFPKGKSIAKLLKKMHLVK